VVQAQMQAQLGVVQLVVVAVAVVLTLAVFQVQADQELSM
jgi:hypothetical protein